MFSSWMRWFILFIVPFCRPTCVFMCIVKHRCICFSFCLLCASCLFAWPFFVRCSLLNMSSVCSLIVVRFPFCVVVCLFGRSFVCTSVRWFVCVVVRIHRLSVFCLSLFVRVLFVCLFICLFGCTLVRVYARQLVGLCDRVNGWFACSLAW